VTIKVHYTSIDRFSQTRSFKTLEGARRYAERYVGPHPEVSYWYAVSPDGVGKVTVTGDATVHDLFPTEDY